ncbi:MAG: PCRF domain-containing protein, partial [Desulfobacterales bacterium]|nr:PCRF domain-containing protein [Desulfobacterales bacterium]
MEIIDKLEVIKNRWEGLAEQMSDPEVITDMKRFVKLNKDYKELEPLVSAYKEYKTLLADIAGAKEVLGTEKDADFREMAKEEIDELEPKKADLEEKIRMLLIPKDPQDSKNVVMEIRAGTGGDEASIFAGDLYRMYQKFCERKKWKIEITRVNEGTAGGYKEIVYSVTGNGAYGILKFESGVHRVQRVPKTETQGRVHTSAAS